MLFVYQYNMLRERCENFLGQNPLNKSSQPFDEIPDNCSFKEQGTVADRKNDIELLPLNPLSSFSAGSAIGRELAPIRGVTTSATLKDLLSAGNELRTIFVVKNPPITALLPADNEASVSSAQVVSQDTRAEESRRINYLCSIVGKRSIPEPKVQATTGDRRPENLVSSQTIRTQTYRVI